MILQSMKYHLIHLIEESKPNQMCERSEHAKPKAAHLNDTSINDICFNVRYLNR